MQVKRGKEAKLSQIPKKPTGMRSLKKSPSGTVSLKKGKKGY